MNSNFNQHFLLIGLDPAYPGFSVENPGERLDTTDARFVDVMHTNSAKIVGGGLSFPVPIGHVDFWPNGGVSQPVPINNYLFETFVG